MKVPDLQVGQLGVIIGTRTYVSPSWVHVDIDSTPLYFPKDGSLRPVDIVCDAENLTLPDNYADVVFSSEAIEHFSWRKTKAVIKEWARIVKPGGVLVVDAPDFVLAANQILQGDSLETDLAMQQIFFAEQLNQYDIHLAGITHRTLSYFMEEAGLTIEDVQRGSDYGWLHIVGRKSNG